MVPQQASDRGPAWLFEAGVALLEPFPRRWQVAHHLRRAAHELGLSRATVAWLPRPLLDRAFPVVPLGHRALEVDAEALRRPVVVLPRPIGEPAAIESGAVYAGADEQRAWGVWITTTYPLPWRTGAPALAWCIGPVTMLMTRPDAGPDLSAVVDRRAPGDVGLLIAADAIDMGLRTDHRVRAATARMIAADCPQVALGLRRPLLLGHGLVELGDAHIGAADYRRALLSYDLAYRAASLRAAPADGAIAAQRMGRALRLQSQWQLAETWYERAVRLAELAGRLDLAAVASDGLGNVALMRGANPLARTRFSQALVLARAAGDRVALGRAHHSLMLLATDAKDWTAAIMHGVEAVRAQPHDEERALTLIGLSEVLLRGRLLEEAEGVLRAALELGADTERRALIASTLALIPGLRGDGLEFSRRRDQVEVIGLSAHALAQIGLHDAEALAALGRWDAAEDAARRTIAIGEETGVSAFVIKAEELLANIRKREVPSRVDGVEPPDSVRRDLLALQP